MPARTTSLLLASALLIGVIALFASPAAAHDSVYASNTWEARLMPTFFVPRGTRAPSGTATVTFHNTSSATLMWDVKNIENCTMMHIHNGTLTMPGNVLIWAFMSTLPPAGAFNPVTGSFSGVVTFDPTATSAGALIQTNMAYFNVHTVEYPNGAIQGMFMEKEC